ncbi:MAG: GNAT family N-acetyltransferase [Candidatus Bathyarchaeia archaeon]
MKLVIRNFNKDDMPAVFDFYKVKDLLPSDSYKFQPYTMNDFYRLIIEEGPFGERFDQSGFFLAFENGKLVGVARAHVGSQSSDQNEKVGFITPEWPWSPVGFAVLPQYRRKGIGSMLLERCFEYLRGKDAKLVQTSTDEMCASRVNFFSKYGFKPWGKTIVFMERDLRKPIPKPILPEGYLFEQFRSDEKEELIECHNKLFEGEWLYIPRSVAGFVNFYERNPDFDPTGFFNITYKGEIVGFIWNIISKSYVENSGRKLGLLEVLGVAKEHRQKGLGTALTLRALIWHREKGMDHVSLNTHSDVARNLYIKCGFEIVSRWQIMRRPLSFNI